MRTLFNKVTMVFLALTLLTVSAFAAEPSDEKLSKLDVIDRMSGSGTYSKGSSYGGYVKGKGQIAEIHGQKIAEITESGDMIFKGEVVGQWSPRKVLKFDSEGYELVTYTTAQEYEDIFNSTLP